jgi:beta-lactamase class A
MKNADTSRNAKQYFLFIIGGIVGVLWTLWYSQYDSHIGAIVDYSIRQSGYDFINPLLECEIQNSGDRQKYIPFEAKTIERIQKEIIETHSGMTIGLYVRNLNNGPWFGINENEKYSPASLMKVPIFITFLKWMEMDPSVINNKILVQEDKNTSTQYFRPSRSLTIWREYSIKELLEEMIIYSDNSTMNILTGIMPIDFYTKVSKDLSIKIPKKDTEENYLSVKEVATFFRILYNASYLDRDSSEYALNILSKATFGDGIRAWVPQNIEIAHKFWERGYTDENGKMIRQLHDCGIVYYKKYPYLMCMVTKWDDFATNASVISNTSKIVFEEISRAFPEK